MAHIAEHPPLNCVIQKTPWIESQQSSGTPSPRFIVMLPTIFERQIQCENENMSTSTRWRSSFLYSYYYYYWMKRCANPTTVIKTCTLVLVFIFNIGTAMFISYTVSLVLFNNLRQLFAWNVMMCGQHLSRFCRHQKWEKERWKKGRIIHGH